MPLLDREVGVLIAALDRGCLGLRVRDDEAGLGAARALADGEQSDPALGGLGGGADELGDLLLRGPGLEGPAEARRLLPAQSLQPTELLGGEARFELRDDVEVDERDRARGDHGDQDDEPVAEGVEPQGVEPQSRSESRKR
jgi:hypothetical protein